MSGCTRSPVLIFGVQVAWVESGCAKVTQPPSAQLHACVNLLPSRGPGSAGAGTGPPGCPAASCRVSGGDEQLRVRWGSLDSVLLAPLHFEALPRSSAQRVVDGVDRGHCFGNERRHLWGTEVRE